MAKFKFRLQSLLNLRRADRQQRRAELAAAYRADEVLARQSDVLAGEIAEVRRRSLDAAAPGRVDVDALIAAQRYEHVLRARSKVLSGQSQRLTAEIEQRRLALVEADRQVRVLEKLAERQSNAQRADELRHEINRLDEVALSRRPDKV